MRKVVYPGTFDPITYGHIDVIKRGLNLFDELIVAVTTRPRKKTLFSLEDRVKLAKESLENMKNVQVKSFNGLLVDFLKLEKASIILRGLREVSDFESEFQTAILNRKLADYVETVFVMTNEKYFYLNSTAVKEIASLGGDISGFVPKPVEKMLRDRLK